MYHSFQQNWTNCLCLLTRLVLFIFQWTYRRISTQIFVFGEKWYIADPKILAMPFNAVLIIARKVNWLIIIIDWFICKFLIYTLYPSRTAPHVHHVLRCDDNAAIYSQDQNSERYSVGLNLKQPPPGSRAVTVL